KAALSGCSTNTFQPVVGTVAHAVSTFTSRKFRPSVDPVLDEARALVTWVRDKVRCVKAALLGFGIFGTSQPRALTMGRPLSSTAYTYPEAPRRVCLTRS